MVTYIILGIIQGFTEFLPVSSSGHLAVAGKLAGMQTKLVELEIVLHLGTVAAVCIFFFRQILASLRNKATVSHILIATLITGAIGVIGKDFFESLFSSIPAICAAWALTGVILLLTRGAAGGTRVRLTGTDAAIVGISQALAIIPGVSRSGVTIATLLFRGVDRTTSFTFSFLISVPAVLGAAALKAKNIGAAWAGQPFELAAGFAASCICGLIALWLLRKAIERSRFYYFGYYTIAIAALCFLAVR